MSVFVVTARRYGNREAHSYLVGVYKTKHAAQQARLSVIAARGGKYDCDIDKTDPKRKAGTGDSDIKSIHRCEETDLTVGVMLTPAEKIDIQNWVDLHHSGHP